MKTLFPVSANFSRETCRLLARAAQAAYSKPAEIEALVRSHGAWYFRWIDDKETDTQCFIAATATDIVVSFRGSESFQDWVSDLKVRREQWFGYSVHRGFLAALENGSDGTYGAYNRATVLGRIAWELTQEDLFHKRLWITGHSLGGALAVLAAFYLKREMKLPVTGVYTFGQPRVGSADFCTAYDLHLKDCTFRITNEKDIVPRVPAWLAGYRHCGTEIFLDSFGKIQVDPPWWKRIPSHIWGLAGELDVVLPITKTTTSVFRDHSVNAYTSRLEKH